MPGQGPADSQRAAARGALEAVTEAGSGQPLLDAARMLLNVRTQVGPESPGWDDFTRRLAAWPSQPQLPPRLRLVGRARS
jgi:hypothetical protein